MNEPETAAQQDIYPLDDALIALFAEFREQAQMIEAQARGALVLFIRQHGLSGNWQLAPNGRELVRVAAQQTNGAQPTAK
jgi:hypothetical protein